MPHSLSPSLFTERMQSRFNRWMTDLDVKVSENCSDYSQFTMLESQLKEMVAEYGEVYSASTCFLELAQATITELGKDGRAADQTDVLACWLIFFYYRIEKGFPDVGKMVEMLHLHLDSVKPSKSADVRVRNICMLLSIMCQIMYIKKEEMEALFSDKLATFLVKVILNNKSNYTLLYALMCFGPFSVVDELRHIMSKQEFLKLNLEQFSSNAVGKFNLESVYARDEAYVLRFRIGECAQWLLDYLFGAGTSLPIEECAIKLLTSKKYYRLHQITRDNYMVFGFDYLWQNYQSSQGIDTQSGDVFYYEAILLTQGSFHVGWTLKTDNELKYGFKDLKESIAFDPYEKRIKVHGVKEYYRDLPSVKPCDVVGCLLDTSAGTFKFYLNGFEIPHTWKLPEYKLKLASELYYPTACLSAYQQVYFNFGQAPFRFAPTDVEFRDICGKVHNTPEVIDTTEKEAVNVEENFINQQVIAQIGSCVSEATSETIIDTSEKEVNVENHLIDFADQDFASLVTDRGVYMPALAEAAIGTGQEKFNGWMKMMGSSVLRNVSNEKETREELMESLLELVKSEEDCIKLARAMITEMSATDRVDVMAMWMMSYMKLFKPPAPDKVIQLVQPYLESYINETSQVTNEVSIQLRNICILISILPQVYQSEDALKSFIAQSIDIIYVLVKLVSPANEHKSSKLYALFCIQSLEKSCFHLKGLLKSQFKRQDFDMSLIDQLRQNIELTMDSCDYEQCQVNLLKMWLSDCLFGGGDGEVIEETDDGEESGDSLEDSMSTISSEEPSNASSNHSKDSNNEQATCVHYFYDWIDYNYRTTICFHPANDSVCFFEAFLMTSGSARVGWALSSEDRKDNALQCSSIFFDAYEKCIYLDGKPHPIETPLKSPKPGTVIGCLLNITSGTFSFYFDGELVPFSVADLHLSSQPYFPTASLAAFQQVYLNFTTNPFKYPPKEIQRRMAKKMADFRFELSVLLICLLAWAVYFILKYFSISK